MSEALSELDVANVATSVADPGAGAETTPADGAAPAAEPAVPTPEPAAPAINWDDLNLLNQAAEAIQRLGYNITPNQAQPEPVQAQPEWDPFDKAAADAYLQAQNQPLVDRISALESQLRAQEQAHTNEVIDTRIDLAIDAAQLAPAQGQTAEQLHAAVLSIANGFASQKMAQFGQPRTVADAQRLGDEAITEAVAFLNAHRAAAAAQGVENYRQDLTRDGSHLLEPGVRGAGVEGVTPATSELDVARRFMDARRGQ